MIQDLKLKEMKSKKKRIRKKLLNILLSSTSHGIPNIIRTDKKRFKIMYFCFFLICSSLCAYMLTKSVLDYLKFDVVTEIDMIYETPTQFPTVTFFNLKNPTANFTFDDILINCHFNDDNCDANDFEEKRDKFGYISYQFNKKFNKSQNLKQSTTAGKINGLQVELFSAFLDEMILYDYVTARYFRFDGFQVVVHNYSMDPRYYGGISFDGSEISTGFSTNLIVNRVFNYRLEEPFNNCHKNLSTIDSFDSDFYKFMLKSFNYSYRQKDCIDYCIGRELIKECNLDLEIDNYVNIWENFKANYSIIECIIRVYNGFVGGKINDICVPICPLECDSISYEISTSFSKFPKLQYANELMNNSKIKSKYPKNYTITYDDMLKSMIAFNVFYNDLRYTKISQIPKTMIVDLVSNMGGILGLFIGVSFLSFGELAEIALEIIFILCEKKKEVFRARV